MGGFVNPSPLSTAENVMSPFDRAANRFKTCLTVGLAALLVAPSAWAGAALPDTPDAWRAAAKTDIETAVKLTRENHPGMHDPHNPGFIANLEAARAHGLALASKVTDATGYVAAVAGFQARIGDGHAGMYPRIDDAVLPKSRWPGFVTVWRGDALYVFAAQDGQPPTGSKLVACDGKPARQVILDNVFSFEGRAAEAGRWWSRARSVFLDWHNPFIELPKRCSFEVNGKLGEHVLAWRALDAQAERWFADSNAGDARPVGITEPRKNLYWVSMPTFQPNEEERAAYRAMTREIEQNRARYLAADAIVVDLRKNQGGSSTWSADFARALWGKERVRHAMTDYFARTEVWWRASQANTEYVFSMADKQAKEGRTESAASSRIEGEGMRAALARGEPFYVQAKSRPTAPTAAGAEVAPFTRPFYVIVPGNCASACLDAIDVFTRFPNTTLVGAPSSADSTYMEVRHQDLASGLAAVIVPNKVWVNRPRANGQVYHPKLPVLDVVWSMPVLLKTVEKDLAR